MSDREKSWDVLVRQIEKEIQTQGPSATDDRKVRFLIAAYLRDIRDQLRRFSGRVDAPSPVSSWDVGDESRQDDDTRPFAFVDGLRAPIKGNDPDKGKPDED